MSLEPYKRLAWKTNELSSKSLSKRLLSRFVRSKLEVRIQEIWRQQRLEVQTFPAVATDP